MNPILQVRDLTYTYSIGTPFEHTALDKVNFALNRGEFVGIIGHTGSGKSTLMQQLNAMQMQNQECCCENRAAIAQVRYDMATQACDTRNTVNTAARDIIDNQNQNSRAILDFLTQSKMRDLESANQELRLAASQAAQAFAGVEEMRKHVDALLVINNERLCKIYPDLSWTTAFAKADDSLSNAARSIAELVSKDGKINLDFADVRTTLKDGGAAVISTGSGEGEHRMSRAIQNALTSPLLKESDIYGAERVLFNLYFSPEEGEELRMQESKELSEFMLRFKKKVNVIWGYTHDSSLGKAVKITILATGFEVSDLTFKGEYGGDADEHIAQSQYIVLKPDQLDDNDLLEKLDKTPAYDRPKDFRDNFDGSEKKEESNGSGRRTIRF